MSAKQPLSFKSNIEPQKLRTLVVNKLHYKGIGQFVNQAIQEKLERETVYTNDPEMARMISKLTDVLYEYKDWKFMKPSHEILNKMNKDYEDIKSGKVKTVPQKG